MGRALYNTVRRLITHVMFNDPDFQSLFDPVYKEASLIASITNHPSIRSGIIELDKYANMATYMERLLLLGFVTMDH